jgi:hypothetical protein
VLVASLLDKLAHPQSLTWPQTATLLWMLVLVAAALSILMIWLPTRRSARIPVVIGWIVIVWTGVLLALSDVIRLLHVGFAPPPIAVLAPLHLVAYGALSAYGVAWIARPSSPR